MVMGARRGGLAGLAAVLLVMIVAGVAHGATIYHLVGPSGFGAQGGGYGRYDGTITYNTAKKFSWQIDTQDLCPGDGLGVSFYWEIDLRNQAANALTDVEAFDLDGCGNGAFYDQSSEDRARDVLQTRLIHCWTNDGDLCWLQTMDSPDNWTNNPNA